MLWYVIMGVLAAFGALSLFWACLCWLLPGKKGTVTVFLCGKNRDETGAILRHWYLKRLGFSTGKLIVAGGELPDPVITNDVLLCSREELPFRLEEEWSKLG